MSAERTATPLWVHRVEITVSGAIWDAENGGVLGDNVADVTLAFGHSIKPLPEGAPDELVNRAIGNGMAPILAAIQFAITSLGYLYQGEVADPMLDHSTPTGKTGRTPAVRVRIPIPDQPEAKA